MYIILFFFLLPCLPCLIFATILRVLFWFFYTKMDKLRIISLNVRGMGTKEKRNTLFKYFRENKYDVICLQETHSTARVTDLWCMEWGSNIFFSHGSSNSRGVCILVNKRLNDSVVECINHDYGRYNIVKLNWRSISMTICNVYGHNVDDESLFVEIFEILKSDTYAGELMILGDYNVTLNPEIDRTDNKQTHPKVAKCILENMDYFNLADLWRCRNPSKVIYSWQRFFNKLSASRIDFVLSTQGINNSICGIKYINGIRSDHQAIEIVFVDTGEKRGPGIWKFNNTLLSDISYCESMSLKLKELVCTDFDDDIAKWEAIKLAIIQHSRTYSRRKAALANSKLKKLEDELEQVKNQIDNKSSGDICHRLDVLKRHIDDIHTDKAKAAAFRARAVWLGEGQSNTKYFFALEKANYKSKTAVGLYDKKGNIIYDQKLILEMKRQFYEELYTSDPTVRFSLENSTDVVINEVQCTRLDRDISKSELLEALKLMKNDKAPGCDGITVNFYKKFWAILEDSYYNMITAAIYRDELPMSSMQGCIALMPKKGRDPYMLKNWHPLTLLNNDYKILSKALAIRLSSTLDDVIAETQTGFLKDRQISLNVRKVLDIIQQLERQHKGGYILNLDYVKCFDKIEISAILGAL